MASNREPVTQSLSELLAPYQDARRPHVDVSLASQHAHLLADPLADRVYPYDSPLELLRDHLGFNFRVARHFEIMNEHLVALERREITSLMIMAPPQHGKSKLASVAFPAWYLGKHPNHNVIGAAYNSEHAQGFSQEARDIVLARQEEMGIQVNPAKKGRNWWQLMQGGAMYAAGLDSGITGKPSHLLQADDPIKSATEAHSPAHKLTNWRNWLSGCETRLQPDGIRMVIMTRWAKDDLCGKLLDEQPEEWTVLKLEAICETEDDPMGRAIGEALWPDHYTREVLDKRRERVGDYNWVSMYQQRPQKRPPDHDPMIPYADCNACIGINVDHENKHVDIGLDVSRKASGDKTVFTTVQGDDQRGKKVIDIEAKAGQSLMQTADDAAALINKTKARSIRIDDGGLGGGVTDRLNELAEQNPSWPLYRCEVIPVNFGEKPWDHEHMADMRTEMHMSVADQLRERKLSLPRDPEQLHDDLTAPQLLQTPTGKNKLESKQAMARRGINSTDYSDSLALAAYPHEWFERAGMW